LSLTYRSNLREAIVHKEDMTKDFSWFDNLLTISGTYLPSIRSEVHLMLMEHDLKHGSEQPKMFKAYRVSGRLIKKAAFKTAAMGGLTSVPATLPLIGTVGTVLVGSAIDLYYLLRIQIELCYGISVAYEVDMDEEELKAITLAILGFTGSAQAVKTIAASAFRRAIDEMAEGYIKTGLAKASTDVATRLIPRLLGNSYKIIPFLGIPLGASVNVLSTMTVGNQARRYFNILAEEGPKEIEWLKKKRSLKGNSSEVIEITE
jgi:hypothetical protein